MPSVFQTLQKTYKNKVSQLIFDHKAGLEQQEQKLDKNFVKNIEKWSKDAILLISNDKIDINNTNHIILIIKFTDFQKFLKASN